MVKTNQGARNGRVLAMLAAVVALVAPAAVAQVDIYPTADFFANPPRQAPGKPVQFTDLSSPQEDIVGWRWEFGDNLGDPVDSTARNPTHTYAAAGVYTVTLEVENRAGYVASVSRDVEIVELPFADFYGQPVTGAPPLAVSFFDTSQGANGAVVRSWRWNFGDDSPELLRGPNVQHTYQAVGQYTVTLTVTFTDGTTATITKDNYIDVAESQQAAATFDAASRVRNTEALLPLNDWVPLFSFRMAYGDPGFRYLRKLQYVVTSDLILNENDRDYLTQHPHQFTGTHYNESGPDRVDILDFALFYDEPVVGTPDELDVEDDLLFTWDNNAVDGDGTPIGTVTGANGGRDEGPLTYSLDFVQNRTPGNPVHRISAGPEDPNNGNHYIVAVRTSALWHSGMTMGVVVEYAEMYNPFGPTGDDTYPNDDWSDPVFEEVGYSASFSAHDFTQYPYHNGADHGDEWRFGGAWTYPRHYYTPLAEYTRPRWDVPGNLFEFFLGETIALRELFSVEAWTPLVGINMHGTHVLHWPDSARPFDFPVISSSSEAGLAEVNMVFQDIGAKPGDPAGSGGFDPRSHLDPMTASFGPVSSQAGNYANGRDFAFNGVWVYHDTNGNGIFDAPAPDAAGGVFFDGTGAGDYPMWPGGPDEGSPDMADPYKERWRFIGNPPDGGDPWWRMKIRLTGERRRPAGEDPTGGLEPTPDNLGPSLGKSLSEHTYDYFVVFRADSGFQDISLLPGDGTGYQPGADFKAFVEPRWFDPELGHWQGGIYADSMIPYVGSLSRADVLTAWQDDSRWLLDEPFWPERTTNSTTSKPMRGGVEVHDYTMLYDSDSQYKGWRDIYYPGGGPRTFPYDFLEWDDWMDPQGTRNNRFYYGAYDALDRRNVWTWYLHGTYSLFGTSIIVDDEFAFVFPFETTPFFSETYDGSGAGPRSSVYIDPPVQPDLPIYETWFPGDLPPGRYPSIQDWAPNEVRARYLKQRTDINSRPTPILGINLVGAEDPFTNRASARFLNDLYVAFWGPDFDPRTDLMPLDPAGGAGSGVQLRFDADGDGSYNNPNGLPGVTVDSDPPVPLKELAWQKAPEFVDLDGDETPDDLSGDGQVTDADKAWVLRMIPLERQYVPSSDANDFAPTGGGGGGDGDGDGDGGGGGDDDDEEDEKSAGAVVAMTERGTAIIDGSRISTPKPLHQTTQVSPTQEVEPKPLANVTASPVKASVDAAPKAVPAPKLVPADSLIGNPGDDLFITIQTSDKLKRFENFRAFIPATLPERERTLRSAGIHMEPAVVLHPNALQKVNPEEMPVQDYYGHDMVEINVPVKLTDLTGAGQTITKDSQPFAAIGIDISTNRGAAGTAASGTSGTGGPGTFLVNGAGWVPNAYAGCFLIDASYEAFEILSNTETQLTLLGNFQPRNGRWFIAKDPTFLEQVIVEFYQEGDDGQFNIIEDLRKLDKDDLLGSGVAIYRDADENPANRNGLFDPGIDLPVPLNDDPTLIGEVGEPETQVLFVFSSPGTDDLPVPRAQQPHLRRWVPDTFPESNNDPFKGDDFFVVIRTSNTINVGDDFTVGLVSWGPDTPTQPDADTFRGPNVPMNATEDLAKYLEFPSGSRALGFITIFQQAPDDSGYNWIRTSAMKALKTKKITASTSGGNGGGGGGGTSTVTITGVTPSVVPTQIPVGGTSLTIAGKGFGTAPVLRLNGDSSIVQLSQPATDTQIVATIAAGTVFPEGPVIVQVQNPGTGATGSANNLLTAVAGRLPDAPVINTIDPASGTKDDFPVSIFGKNFTQMPDLEVRFGGRRVPVAYVSPEGTRIDVNFPPEDLLTGPLDVEVTSIHFIDEQKVSLKTVKPDGFFYSNPAGGVQPCFIATAAYGTPFAEHLDSFRAFRDGVLLKTAAGTAVVDLYYSTSPAVADEVAAHPWLAVLVRAALTPVAWAIEQPVWVAAILIAIALAAVAGRRRRAKA